MRDRILLRIALVTALAAAVLGIYATTKISLTTQVSGILPIANGGTNKNGWTASKCVDTSASGNLQSTAADCLPATRTIATSSPLTGGGDLSADRTLTCPTCNTSSATVSNFTSGNLAPLFTTSVATATTTPAQTFSLSNAGAYTLFARNAGTSGAPAYTAYGSIFGGACNGASSALTFDGTGTFGCNTITTSAGGPSATNLTFGGLASPGTGGTANCGGYNYTFLADQTFTATYGQHVSIHVDMSWANSTNSVIVISNDACAHGYVALFPSNGNLAVNTLTANLSGYCGTNPASGSIREVVFDLYPGSAVQMMQVQTGGTVCIGEDHAFPISSGTWSIYVGVSGAGYVGGAYLTKF
jgi:hypothetical protein